MWALLNPPHSSILVHLQQLHQAEKWSTSDFTQEHWMNSLSGYLILNKGEKDAL